MKDFRGPDSFDPENNDAYARWRDDKLHGYPDKAAQLVVEIADPNNPRAAEIAALKSLVAKTNMALYAFSPGSDGDVRAAKKAITGLAGIFGLSRLDANLCADDDAITSLSVAAGGRRGRYIPYSDRAINWHTDGYYNRPEHAIRGMILHCVSPAAAGGASALMDPEIVYILMREENPDLVAALMRPDAMLIPANRDGDAEIRPACGGPVFSLAGDDGSLHMRYTARSRSIAWRRDGATRAAAAFIGDCLKSGGPYIFSHRMAAGEGVLCNNVLHNRTAFEDDRDHRRLYLRARYFDRITS